MKINKSQLAMELGINRHTLHKYINEFVKLKTRKWSLTLEEYYDIIRELLSKSNQQIFMNSVSEKK